MTLVEALNDIATRLDGNSQEWRLITNAADQLTAVPALKEALRKAEVELENLRELQHALRIVASALGKSS